MRYPDQIKMGERKRRFCNKKQNKLVLYTVRPYETSLSEQARRPDVKRLLLRARRDIGYSPKTVDVDILSSLYKQARSSS